VSGAASGPGGPSLPQKRKSMSLDKRTVRIEQLKEKLRAANLKAEGRRRLRAEKRVLRLSNQLEVEVKSLGDRLEELKKKDPAEPPPRKQIHENGMSRYDVEQVMGQAAVYLETGQAGRDLLEKRITHMTLVSLLIEGIYGTELWRTQGMGMAGRVFASANRARFIENATQLLRELRERRDAEKPHGGMLEGVLDAEMTPGGGADPAPQKDPPDAPTEG